MIKEYARRPYKPRPGHVLEAEARRDHNDVDIPLSACAHSRVYTICINGVSCTMNNNDLWTTSGPLPVPAPASAKAPLKALVSSSAEAVPSTRHLQPPPTRLIALLPDLGPSPQRSPLPSLLTEVLHLIIPDSNSVS